MVEKVRHLERRVLQPAVPHSGVAEYLYGALGGAIVFVIIQYVIR